jgi:hypothetical protein
MVLFDATGGGEGMRYVLLFCGSAEDAAAFAALTPDELRARREQVGAWFGEHRSKIGGSNQLQGPETATSVRFGPDGPPVVTDGPYLEGKESIGGYAEIEVADLDEALRIPDRPGAWLWTVARRRAIDVLRRDVRYRERAAAVRLPSGRPRRITG